MRNERLNEIVMELVNMEERASRRFEMLWGELYASCVGEIRKMATRKQYKFACDYDLEDFEQNVMIDVFENLDKYDASRSKFNTWLWRVAKNIYATFWRRRNNLETVSMYVENVDGEMENIIDQYAHTISVEKEYFGNLGGKRLYDAIDSLKDNYREVVRLCDLEGMKPREASRVLGQESAIVYRWLNRAHDKLESMVLNEELEEDIFL